MQAVTASTKFKRDILQSEIRAHITVPLILTAIFVLSSFVPVIQTIILTLNGGYLASIEDMISSTNANTKSINLLGNLLPTLLLLFWFYNATNKIGQFIAAILAMVFMTAFFYFMTMDDNEEHEPYWLQFLIIALVSGFILTIVAYIKYKRTKEIKNIS